MGNPGTGVDVQIDGSPIWNVNTYSSVEDSTAVDPSDTTGGFGQISISTRDSPAAKVYIDKVLSLTDGANGETTGIIQGASGNGLKVDVTANSRLALTAVTRQAPPFVGTLGDALRAYLALCSVTTGIVVDDALESVPVKLVGWNAVVYDQLKKLATARSFEMSLVSNNIVFRPLRTRIAETRRDASVTWSLDSSNLAQAVEGYSYTTSSGTGLVYPRGGWNQDVIPYSLDAGQTTQVNIPVDVSLTSLEQPLCVGFVSRDYAATSVYSVSGNDGIAIPPAQWAAGGGNLTVAIGKDGKSVDVTIVASRDTQYAPYKIAVSSGPSDYYSSLRLRGSGVFFDKQMSVLPANLNADKAPQEIGATVDNEFFETADQLHHSLLWAAARYSSARQSISVSSKGINRAGDSGSQRYPTISDVEAIYDSKTIDQRYVQLGPTINDWNQLLFDNVRSDFFNQAFGNVSGARVLHGACWYRIRTATIGPNKVDYSAEWDTTVNDAFPGVESIAQWNAHWAGETIADFNAAPLRNIGEPLPPEALFPSPSLAPDSGLYPVA